MNTGYTKDLPPEEKRKNEIEAIKSILQDDPNNEYWKNRLAVLTCCCFEIMGDNENCPIHGNMFRAYGAFTTADYQADYQERNELYMMGMGA